MRVALAGLLGCAAGAPGRDIPVYREYTLPVLFYDERGEVTAFNAAGPDLAALQSVRDMKAREGLIGKEILLDLTFKSGASVFGGQAPPTGKMAPRVDGGADRRQENDSGRNWLAASLSLPGLGQAPTNAAESVMSSGAKESSWGWLADDVASQPGEAARRDELRAEEEFNPAAAQEAAIMEGNNPFGTDRAAANAAKETEKVEQEPSTSAAFPEGVDTGQKPSDQATERSEASTRDMEGGGRMASSTIKDSRVSPFVAEMSQTHQMISELSVGSRPDFSASFRTTAIGAPAGSGSGAEREISGRSGPDFPSSAGGATDWGTLGSHQGFSSSSMGAAAPAVPSWGGGWSAQNAEGGGGISSRFESPSDPTPAPVVPVPPSGSSRPGTSSGGYKPAWF
jgi:hypothetical protein